MANVKTRLTKSPEWAKHLKKAKRIFWKKERQNAKKES